MSRFIPEHRLGRRDFLRASSRLALAAALPGRLGARAANVVRRGAAPVRVRGRVRAAGRGLGGVAVSDGLSVVVTDRDGRFELVSDRTRRHVFVSPPRGVALPTSPHGTLRLHRPIAADARGEMDVRFELAPGRDDETHHDVVAIADPHLDEAEMRLFDEQTFPDVLRTIGDAEAPVAFGATVGDIVSDALSLFPAYERAVSRLGVPFAQVVGNHDLDTTSAGDGGSTATFERHFGPTYYSLDRGDIHYVVLDDVLWHGGGYIGYVDDAQLAWLAADLARVEAGRTVVVFLHIPLRSTHAERTSSPQWRTMFEVTNREALQRLLEPYRVHLVSGHTHEMEHVFHAKLHEHVLGTACGAWWTGPICWDGTPNGYAVLEARGEEIRWRYKGTGLPADEQMRLYARGADPEAPDEIVATVWDWEPEWTVVWYEGADRRGTMARRRATDPLSVALHAGREKPARRTWIDPVPTAHQFYATPTPGTARELRVEATDRFGRRYVGRLATTGA